MASHIPAFNGRRALRDACVALLSGVLLLVPATGARAEALRQAPGSSIALEIGHTFTVSNRFKGFIDDNSGASVVIVERPGPAFEEMRHLADQPVALAHNGITDTAPRTSRAHRRICLRDRQAADGARRFR